MEDLAAEIEYITVKGISYSPKSCFRCQGGVANQLKSRCELCPVNYYLDDLVTVGGSCKKCPNDKYSLSGSYGAVQCK